MDPYTVEQLIRLSFVTAGGTILFAIACVIYVIVMACEFHSMGYNSRSAAINWGLTLFGGLTFFALLYVLVPVPYKDW